MTAIRRVFVSLLLVGWCSSTALLSQTPSGREILQRFCELDEQGGQLTSEGWRRIASLFTRPGAPRLDVVTVNRSLAVSPPGGPNGAEFYFEYVQLGQLDSTKALFTSMPPVLVRMSLHVTKETSPRDGGPAAWRIVGPVPGPHLSVETAIRYATQLRENASDPAIVRNANRAVVALKSLR